MLDLDIILKEVCEFGAYQKFVVFLLCVPACLLNSYNGFGMVFLAMTPEHSCDVGAVFADNLTNITVGQCSFTYRDDEGNVTTEQCHKWKYSKVYFERTLITDYDLVCDREIYSANMLGFLGVVIILGCVFYSWLQDKIGRKKTFLLSTLTYVVGSSTSLFTPTLFWFTAVRTVSAINQISSWNIAYIWALEFVGPTKRTVVGTFLCVIYAVVLSYFGSMEPKELPMEMGSLKKDVERPLTPPGRKLTADESEQRQHAASYLDLFRGVQLRRKTLLLTFIWVANSTLYVVIAFNIKNIGGNFYVTWVLQAAVEAPATLLNLLIVDRYGRVPPLVGGLALAALCCLLTVVGPLTSNVVVIVLSVMAKFAICITYIIIYQLAGELYPTPVRGVGVGFSSVVGDFGNILMPYIILSASVYRMLPMMIMGSFCLLSSFAALFMPETLDKPMPDTVEEAEWLGHVSMATFKTNCHTLTAWLRSGNKTTATAAVVMPSNSIESTPKDE